MNSANNFFIIFSFQQNKRYSNAHKHQENQPHPRKITRQIQPMHHNKIEITILYNKLEKYNNTSIRITKSLL